MSPRMFKRKMGKGIIERGATYKQGELCYNPELLDNIIGEFLSLTSKDLYFVPVDRDLFDKHVMAYTNKLKPEINEEFKHQDFLDALVTGLTVKEVSTFHIARMDTLFSPLLQALYDLEYNDFRLDVFHLPHSPYTIASSLTGTEDNPLRLSYNGRVFRFGEYASHCSLKSFGPVHHVAGDKACDSELVLHILPKAIGAYGENNKFFLPGVDKVAIGQSLDNMIPPRIQLIIKKGKLATEMAIERRFFTNGNSLYIPDGTGKWKEVEVPVE